MHPLRLIGLLIVVWLFGFTTATAQEGHPLKGSWLGTWGPSKVHSNDVVVVMNWDGKAITGMINPGTDNIPIKNATLNPDGWVVHLEADAKDKSGNTINYIIDGKIENLSFHNRSIVGTWKSQKESGPFKISRQ
jgi:spermidine/putrescine-binding protein